jgi:Amt family ammonium transporter
VKRLTLSLFFVAALFLHFNTGVWSAVEGEISKEEAKEEPKKVEPKVEEKNQVEPKVEEKKPTPDKTGANTQDTSAVEGYKKIDPKKIDHEAVSSNFEAMLNAIGKNRSGINMMWTLITGFLVMFMQAGFALVETGLTRSKNVAHTMAMNIFIYAIGLLSFYFVGFGLMFGGYDGGWFGGDPALLNSEKTIEIFGKPFGLFGQTGFMLMGRAFDVTILAIFLFQMVFMDTAATIPTGALAERWKFLPFVIYGFFMAGFIYPIFGNWVWGGGWLSKLGANFAMGHGHVDFAGSSVVHMTGGICALAGVIVLGPRIGKYNKDGTVNILPAHNVPMYVLGTLILAFGWFGFNPGSTLMGSDLNIARIAVNTMMASAAGCFACTLYMWNVYGKPDVSFMCNGLLAGLVAITAPCAFVTPLSAIIIGGIAGILVVWSAVFWEKIAKIDDPVGAISVHGVNGAWGVLALGLLADGSYGQGQNNSYWYKLNETKLEWAAVDIKGDTVKEAISSIEDGNKDKPEKEKVEVPDFLKKASPDHKLEKQGVTGLFYGNTGQIKAQLTGTLTNIVFVFCVSFAMFFGIEKLIGNRVSVEVEMQGLDVPEMGALGYINDDPKVPEGHLTSSGPEPVAAKVPGDGLGRFTLVMEGVPAEKILAIWSELCSPQAQKPSADFLAVYPKMTILQGNRFRFRDGKPDQLATQLTSLFQAKLPGERVKVRVE